MTDLLYKDKTVKTNFYARVENGRVIFDDESWIDLQHGFRLNAGLAQQARVLTSESIRLVSPEIDLSQPTMITLDHDFGKFLSLCVGEIPFAKVTVFSDPSATEIKIDVNGPESLAHAIFYQQAQDALYLKSYEVEAEKRSVTASVREITEALWTKTVHGSLIETVHDQPNFYVQKPGLKAAEWVQVNITVPPQTNLYMSGKWLEIEIGSMTGLVSIKAGGETKTSVLRTEKLAAILKDKASLRVGNAQQELNVRNEGIGLFEIDDGQLTKVELLNREGIIILRGSADEVTLKASDDGVTVLNAVNYLLDARVGGNHRLTINQLNARTAEVWVFDLGTMLLSSGRVKSMNLVKEGESEVSIFADVDDLRIVHRDSGPITLKRGTTIAEYTPENAGPLKFI